MFRRSIKITIGLFCILVFSAACTISPELANKPYDDFVGKGLTVGQVAATIEALQRPVPTVGPTATPNPNPTSTPLPTPVPPTPTATVIGSVDPNTCFTAQIIRGYYTGSNKLIDISLIRLPTSPEVESTCGTKSLVTVVQIFNDESCAFAIDTVTSPTYKKNLSLNIPQCGTSFLSLWTSRQANLTAAYEAEYRKYLNDEILVQPKIEDYTLKDMIEIRNEVITTASVSK